VPYLKGRRTFVQGFGIRIWKDVAIEKGMTVLNMALMVTGSLWAKANSNATGNCHVELFVQIVSVPWFVATGRRARERAPGVGAEG
jgi:hypothetical protein